MVINRIRRRRFLTATGAAATTALVAGCAGDNGEYPSGSIELVVPASTGGGTDTVARELASRLGDELDTSIEVANQPGAAQLNGPGNVVSSAPDGYTIGIMNLPSSPVAALAEEPDFDLWELEGVAGVATEPIVIVANPDEGFEHDPEALFDAYRDDDLGDPGTIRLSTSHMGLEAASEIAEVGIDDIVGYEDTSTVFQNVASGEVPFGSGTATAAVDIVESGEVDIVCSLTASTAPQFPDAPAFVDDMGYENVDYLSQLTRGIFVHEDVDDDHQEVLTDGIEAVLESDDMQEWADESGTPIDFMSPEEINDIFEDARDQIPEVIDLDEFQD